MIEYSAMMIEYSRSQGVSSTSDHLSFAPNCLAELHTPVFTSLARHRYMQLVFRNAVILTNTKSGNTDSS